MMTFWVAFVICWFVSILLIVAFMYGSSERRQCEHKRCLTSPPHYCIDCGMPVSEEHALHMAYEGMTPPPLSRYSDE